MRELRENINPIDSYRIKETATDENGVLIARTENGRVFELDFPEKLPVLHFRNIDPNTLSVVRQHLFSRARWNFLNSTQHDGHKFTQAFLICNWKMVFNQMGLLENEENCFCFPEVNLDGGRNQTPDLMGYGGNGNLLVIEIGRRGKRGCLKTELSHARAHCHGIPVFGMLVYYLETVDRSRIKLTFPVL